MELQKSKGRQAVNVEGLEEISKKDFEPHREGEGALSGIIDRVLVVLPHFGLLLVPTTYDLQSDLNTSGKICLFVRYVYLTP